MWRADGRRILPAPSTTRSRASLAPSECMGSPCFGRDPTWVLECGPVQVYAATVHMERHTPLEVASHGDTAKCTCRCFGVTGGVRESGWGSSLHAHRHAHRHVCKRGWISHGAGLSSLGVHRVWNC